MLKANSFLYKMKRQNYIRLSLWAVLLLGAGLWSCDSAKKTFNSGVRKFKDGEYDLAIKDFNAALEASYEVKEANRFIAESYRLSNRFREAIPYFKKVVEEEPDNADARFQYAYALKTAGQYDEAKEYFLAAANLANAPENMKSRALREVEILKIMDRIALKKPEFEVENLPVNTPGAEFGPAVVGQELMFSSSRKQKTYKNNGQQMLGIYKIGFGEDPTRMLPGNAALFSQQIFDPEANEGSPAFSPDGKTLVFARGNTGKKRGTTDVKLYMSRNVNGQWSEPRYLPVNDSLAWDGSPAFSRDGKTLYFASNRKGGFGGIDLYSTNMDASGRFSRPVNMGASINTAGDEMFPYVSPDNKLYFASDGHPGLGKLDIFVATRSQGVIAIENMGIPFNTPQDDFGLVFLDDESGFFSSNREGGKGDDDIYYFYVPETETDRPVVADKPEDPATPLIEAHAGDPVRIHVLGVSNEQNGMFSVEKHEWPIEPFMRGADLISVVEFSGSETIDAFLPSAGGMYRMPGDYVYSNQRLPYSQSGQWGYVRVLPTGDTRLLPLTGASAGAKSAEVEQPAAHAIPVASK
ncbi:MAG: hypothetical protein ABS46_15730 [Cytophagaceae bacterium SCN 52-12]|nr:MAG: hypothetical protein ABS46_15730 [Cytophagaceae bacterium SCN 52-12]